MDRPPGLGAGPDRRHSPVSRATLFVVGLSSGALLAANAKRILKAGIKVGVRSGFKLREIAVRGGENFSDVVAEAVSELVTDEHA
ncbi:MAG TPA: hypothetical protein VHA57_02005 [Actinomycetota bacterium]|nr:hypothetical protein [Actinomycetota bacterium]